MNRLLMAVAGLFALGASAQAQVTIIYDTSKVSCADYSAMAPDVSRHFSAWISGWFNQKSNSTTINIEGYRANVASVQKWCASNPKALVMAALDQSAAAAKPGVGGPGSIETAEITCGQFLGSDPEVQTLVASWMGGFFSSTKNITVVDSRYVARNAKVVVAYCKKNKGAKLIDAVKKTWK